MVCNFFRQSLAEIISYQYIHGNQVRARGDKKQRDAVRAAYSTSGGIGYSEFLDKPYKEREIIIDELNRIEKETNNG